MLLLVVVISIFSCREDFEFTPTSGTLEFSKDTVYLDTVFTNIGSSTYTLKVYNRSDNNIEIPSIQLTNGSNSKFRLNVDGMSGNNFSNVELLAKDSMYVFIETTVDITELTASETQFLYTDAIEFGTGTGLQEVPLITLVQDAVFLYPQRFDDGTTETLTLGSGEDATEIYGFVLDDDELHFTNEKPYVIYGYAAVGTDKTLVIDAGARVYFHAESGIIVGNQGSIHVNGEVSTDAELLENEVIFESDRLEPEFADVPGQWDFIWLTAGSTDNIVNHATIKNASVGIIMDSNGGSDTPTLTVQNTQITNSAVYGLWSQTGHILAENMVIGNAGSHALYCSLGGDYTFKHCTIGNYWQNGYRGDSAVNISNYLLDSDGTAYVSDLEAANFYNCIIYGNNNVEFELNQLEDATFNYYFGNSLLRFNPYSGFTDELYDFDDTDHYVNVITNEDPIFFDEENNNFNISEESPANGTANPEEGFLSEDITGAARSTTTPDMGAYESTIWEEDE